MALQFCDGFEKYGTPTNQLIAATIQTAMQAAEWTTASGLASPAIVAGLSAIGYALSIAANAYASKTLASSFSRLIAGLRFQVPALAGSGSAVFTFLDTGTQQVSVVVDGTTGLIMLKRGGTSGTVLSASTVSVSAGSTHYLEADVTFGASAAYQVWLDGVSVISGTGNTKASANSTANQFALNGGTSGSQAVIVDDLYVFDTSGSTNNAVLNTSPQIETQFPTGDSSVQFGFGAAVLGQATQGFSLTSAPGANQLFLRKFTTPALTTVLGSVSCIPAATSAGANFKSVLYTDSSGPNSLVATGTQTTGATSGTILTSSFSSGQTLTSSTAYWLGFITDTSVTLQQTDNLNSGQNKANTYASGAPAGPVTGMTTGDASWIIYGNLTSTGVNWDEENINPVPGDVSYVFDSTSGHEDLYSFPALTTPNPTTIYSVVVKGYIKKSDSGARGVTIQCKSSSTDNGGATVTPGTTYGWIDANFDTDPNTGVAWAASAVNSATSGFKIAS